MSEGVGGHTSAEATYEKVAQRHYWPGLLEEVERFVAGCAECRRPRGLAPTSANIRSDLYDGQFVVLYSHPLV